VFSDEHARCPAGTHARNPPGTVHAPFSVQGRVNLVKLRQMAPQDRPAVHEQPESQAWHDAAAPGLSVALLDAGTGLSVSLERLRPGAARPHRQAEARPSRVGRMSRASGSNRVARRTTSLRHAQAPARNAGA
jgi:hypothetical protein